MNAPSGLSSQADGPFGVGAVYRCGVRLNLLMWRSATAALHE